LASLALLVPLVQSDRGIDPCTARTTSLLPRGPAHLPKHLGDWSTAPLHARPGHIEGQQQVGVTRPRLGRSVALPQTISGVKRAVSTVIGFCCSVFCHDFLMCSFVHVSLLCAALVGIALPWYLCILSSSSYGDRCYGDSSHGGIGLLSSSSISLS
jgi:hypothetical protein